MHWSTGEKILQRKKKFGQQNSENNNVANQINKPITFTHLEKHIDKATNSH